MADGKGLRTFVSCKKSRSMKTKQEIVENWLPRYTERRLEDFTRHVLLTNFTTYVERFAAHYGVPVLATKGSMPNAAADGITIINFGMGSANAATIMDLLSAIRPEAALFLGKCGGLKEANRLGDYLLPIAAIRGEGTSDEYLPPEVPSLPAFSLLRAVSSAIRDRGKDYLVGHTRPGEGLLDRDGLYHQPPRVGVRHGLQGVPPLDACHGHRHGDRHAPHGRLCEPNPYRCAPHGVGQTDGGRRHQDGGERPLRDRPLRFRTPPAGRRGVEALRQIIEGKKTVHHIRFSW